MYRFCDSVWTFTLKNASFKTTDVVTAVDLVKIIAYDARIVNPKGREKRKGGVTGLVEL